MLERERERERELSAEAEVVYSEEGGEWEGGRSGTFFRNLSIHQ